MVDLLISSQIPAKLKHKLAIVKSLQSNENEESLGQLPFFLLKSVAFLEALTAMISIDARTRPVYEKSTKIGEHVFFVLQSTELFGIIQMISSTNIWGKVIVFYLKKQESFTNFTMRN